MLAILNCQSQDVKSYRHGKADGGNGEPHSVVLPHPQLGGVSELAPPAVLQLGDPLSGSWNSHNFFRRGRRCEPQGSDRRGRLVRGAGLARDQIRPFGSAAGRLASAMKAALTDISCSAPQCGHDRRTGSNQVERRVAASISMPVAMDRPVVGQENAN
jgi:hypothetical protein